VYRVKIGGQVVYESMSWVRASRWLAGFLETRPWNQTWSVYCEPLFWS